MLGKQITPHNYSAVNFTNHRFLITQNDSITHFITPKGEIIKSLVLDSLIKKTDPKIPVKFPLIIRRDKKFGMLNSSLEIIVPTEYDILATGGLGSHVYLDEYIYKVKKDGKVNFIDSNNNLQNSIWFDELLWNGIVEKDSLFGWVTSNGKLKITPQYEKLKPLVTNSHHIFQRVVNDTQQYYFIVNKGEKIGLIDASNAIIIDYDFGSEEIGSVYIPVGSHETYFILKKQGKWGAVNTKKETVVPFEYDYFEADFDMFMRFKFGHYRFIKGKKIYLVDWENRKTVKE